MSGRVKVLGAMWLVLFAVQALGPLTRCVVDVGPVRAAWLAQECIVQWSTLPTVIVAVVALVWHLGWPEGQGIDPDDPHPPLPPPPG